MSTTWEEDLAMRIARLLGLSSIDEDLLAVAGARWESWVTNSDGALDGTADLAGLPDWLWDATPAEADRVLVHLAFLAARDGEDDLAAAGVLAWVLLPGAQAIVCALSRQVSAAEEVVAAQLWMQVRTFPWRTGHRVAANILRNTRKNALLDVGTTIPEGSIRRHTLLLDPASSYWQLVERRQPIGEDKAHVTLARLLSQACEDAVITAMDRDLLLNLVEATDRVGQTRARTGNGLLSQAASERVAQVWGCSPRSVRRRARQSLDDLRAAYGTARSVSA